MRTRTPQYQEQCQACDWQSINISRLNKCIVRNWRQTPKLCPHLSTLNDYLGFLCLFLSFLPKHSFWIHMSWFSYIPFLGAKPTEATMTFKYNRQRMTLSSEIQIPDFDVDLGTVLRVSDESTVEKKSYKLTLDLQNKKITEVTLTGRMRYGRLGWSDLNSRPL